MWVFLQYKQSHVGPRSLLVYGRKAPEWMIVEFSKSYYREKEGNEQKGKKKTGVIPIRYDGSSLDAS